MAHRIRVAPSTKMSGRGLYEATCSCGDYRSASTTRPRAVAAGCAHLYDKTINRLKESK